METSSLSPKTQNDQNIIATTTLDNEAIIDNNANTPDMTFAISTKKIDTATEKIYAFNAKKQDNITSNLINDNPCKEQPQIIYLDSSTSPNQTLDRSNNVPEPTPHETKDTPERNPDKNTNDYSKDVTESTQKTDINQLQVENTSQLQMQPSTHSTQTKNEEALKENPPKQLQVEKISSPASSLIYKTPHPRLTQTQYQTSTMRTSLF